MKSLFVFLLFKRKKERMKISLQGSLLFIEAGLEEIGSKVKCNS